MIHLYRHSHAGRRKHWNGPDHERPLSDLGRRESLAIADRLGATGIARILSSPYARCVQSVEPLSDTTGLPIEIDTALEEHGDPDGAMALLIEAEEGTVLCSHGDIVSALVGRLAAEGAELEGGLIWEKGSIWHLDRLPGGRVTSGRYEPPPFTTA